MTPLQNLINSIDSLSDASAVLANITTRTIPHVVYQGEQTIAAIDTAYGPVFAATLVVGFERVISLLKSGGDEQKALGALWQIYFDRFKSPGWDLSDPAIQSRLDGLATFIGQDTVNAIKELGIVMQSKCQQAGIADPTLEQVTADIAFVLNRRVVDAWVATILNEVINPRRDDATISGLIAAIAGVT